MLRSWVDAPLTEGRFLGAIPPPAPSRSQTPPDAPAPLRLQQLGRNGIWNNYCTIGVTHDDVTRFNKHSAQVMGSSWPAYARPHVDP